MFKTKLCNKSEHKLSPFNCITVVLYTGWVDSVRAASSSKVKIVPRVMFEGWSMSDYSMLFSNRDMALDVAKTIKHVLLVMLVIYQVFCVISKSL